MNTQDVIILASRYLDNLSGHIFDVLDISKPITIEAAVNLAKVISKLSPLVGNLIEFNSVEFLNKQNEFFEFGKLIGLCIQKLRDLNNVFTTLKFLG